MIIYDNGIRPEISLMNCNDDNTDVSQYIIRVLRKIQS